MKRVVSSAAVIAASVGILLGGAGTASAQIPWDKYPTQPQCQRAGQEVTSQLGGRYSCAYQASAPASRRWWLYVV